MKIYILIFNILVSVMLNSQTTFTFHTAGDWTDGANWSPYYPGLIIPSGTLVDINQNCFIHNITIINNGAINVNDCQLDIIHDISGHNFVNNGLISYNGFSGQNAVIGGNFENTGEILFQGTYQLILQGVFNSVGILSSNGYGHLFEVPPLSLYINQINPNYYFAVSTSSCNPISAYNLNINGSLIDINYDHIDFYFSCADFTNSTLNINWGFTPSEGQVFDIITHQSRVGQFATVNIPPITGLSFIIDYTDPNKTSLVVTQALPISLNNFNAHKTNNDINLHWQTSSEINNHYFDIEFSTDGTNFTTIGREEGAGNSNTLLDYNFVHKDVSAGIRYYRLKQVDYDGQYSYSDIVSIFVKREGNDVYIYPNPATNIININGADGLYYALYDLVGRQVHNGQISDDAISIDHLATGMYYLHLDSDAGKSVYKVWKK